MKIVVVGLGYVGLSNAVLLAQYNEVIGVDISQERVDMLNTRKSPIIDTELSEYLTKKKLNLSASTDLKTSIVDSDYVIVSTPTNYDEETNFFDTSSVEAVLAQVIYNEPKACIVVKSTIPVGFVDEVRERLETEAVIFSPEFLREGRALFDNLYPSRIIVGEKSKRAEIFADLLAQAAKKKDTDILLTGSREAEAIKLFSNAYLAMRVAYFNELDTFSLYENLNSMEVISGVCSDPRIGKNYNNPSFGYGGYCLPKDTKQLLSNFESIPQNLIEATVQSNLTRKKALSKKIIELNPKIVGVYKVSMKANSDNFRESAVLEIMKLLSEASIKILIHDPNINIRKMKQYKVVEDFRDFIDSCDIILANRLDDKLIKYSDKVFTRDLFQVD